MYPASINAHLQSSVTRYSRVIAPSRCRNQASGGLTQAHPGRADRWSRYRALWRFGADDRNPHTSAEVMASAQPLCRPGKPMLLSI